jgi:lipoprotein NlpI
MRRVVVLCSIFGLFMLAPADAQRRGDEMTPVAVPAAKSAKNAEKKAAPKQPKGKAANKKTEPDTRPILRRADDMAPIAAPEKQQPAKKKARAMPKPEGEAAPADAAKPAASAARATPQDVMACGQVKAPDAAIAGCTKVLADEKQKPKGRAAAFFNRGNAHVAKGDAAAAIADFDEAIKLDPKNASAYNNRGNARHDGGEDLAAIADFDAALKQNPRYAPAYFNRANALAAKGDPSAMKDYDAAIKYNRRNVTAYIARGALLLASGDIKKARADMRQAAALDAKNAYAVLWHDIAEKRAKQKGVLGTGKPVKGLDTKAWPGPLVELFNGTAKADAVLAAADNPDAAVKTGQLCEASFYNGEHALIDGNRDEAVKLFRAAAKACPRGFLEGIAAAAELKGMGEKAKAN